MTRFVELTQIYRTGNTGPAYINPDLVQFVRLHKRQGVNVTTIYFAEEDSIAVKEAPDLAARILQGQ